jgi:antirestriction protein ArdC
MNPWRSTESTRAINSNWYSKNPAFGIDRAIFRKIRDERVEMGDESGFCERGFDQGMAHESGHITKHSRRLIP